MMIEKELSEELFRNAIDACNKAYAPYSNFPVGASLKTSDGKIFNGCNTENASYGLSICAESAAISNMIVGGSTQIDTIVIVAKKLAKCAPCGACRQRIVEFSNDKTTVLLMDIDGNIQGEYKAFDLLPESFVLKK